MFCRLNLCVKTEGFLCGSTRLRTEGPPASRLSQTLMNHHFLLTVHELTCSSRVLFFKWICFPLNADFFFLFFLQLHPCASLRHIFVCLSTIKMFQRACSRNRTREEKDRHAQGVDDKKKALSSQANIFKTFSAPGEVFRTH